MPNSLDHYKDALRGLDGVISIGEVGVIARHRSRELIVDISDIDEYLSIRESIKKENETEIFFPGYYECVINFEASVSFRRRYDPETLSLKSDDESVKANINYRPSPMFAFHITDRDELPIELRRSISIIRPRQPDEENIKLHDSIRLTTFSMSFDHAENTRWNLKKCREIAVSCLFHFAYSMGLAASTPKTWEKTYFSLSRMSSRAECQFPIKTYNENLISYYSMAHSTESVSFSYLSLYNVLEYFYTSVSEEEIHNVIVEKVSHPAFSVKSKAKIRELLKVIKSKESKTDELKSLKLVLAKFFQIDDFENWLGGLPEGIKEYYSGEQEVFSEKFSFNLSDSATINNIASRIYKIRNAIVHSKEGEHASFIPYSGQDNEINKEIFLLKFIAEEVIVRSGELI